MACTVALAALGAGCGPKAQDLWGGKVVAYAPCELQRGPQSGDYKCYHPYKDRKITYYVFGRESPSGMVDAAPEKYFRDNLIWGDPTEPGRLLCGSDLVDRLIPKSQGTCFVDNIPVVFEGITYRGDSAIGALYPIAMPDKSLLWVFAAATIEGQITPEMRTYANSIRPGAGAKTIEEKGKKKQ